MNESGRAWNHECSESDSGYVSFEEAQKVIYTETGHAIEGCGRNGGPSSDIRWYTYLPLGYESVHIKESAQQLEQHFHAHRSVTGSELFRGEYVTGGSQGEYNLEADDRNECGGSLSNVKMESLVGQQMSLMMELIRLLNTQVAQLREQINSGNKLWAKPEKFAGTSSFHSFMAKFENCCEINGWDEREKLLMLKDSLTGNAATILWEFGSEKRRDYSELVLRLRARYGFEGQSESFRLQLRSRKQHHGETLSRLEQDIRKLITLAYPGEASGIIESIACDTFIEALSDRDLAMRVLSKEPETLEEAYHVATKLKSCKDLIYADEKHNSRVSESDEKICALERERVEHEQKQTSDEMKGMVQAIQEMTKKVSQFGEDLEKLKCLSTYRISPGKSDNNEGNPISKARPYKARIRCFLCNREGHMKFACPDKDDTYVIESRRRYKPRSFHNTEGAPKTRTVKSPPRSEVSAALEEFLDDFETLFCGEVQDEHDGEVVPGKVLAHRLSDPSAPGSFQKGFMSGKESGSSGDLVGEIPRDSDTVSSCIGRIETDRVLVDQLTVNQETIMLNRGSTGVEVNAISKSPEPNTDEERLVSFKDSVCSSFTRCKKPNRKARRPQTPIPRPCVYCQSVIGSRSLMRRHIQAEHWDVLMRKKRSRQLDSEREAEAGRAGTGQRQTCGTIEDYGGGDERATGGREEAEDDE